MLAHSFHRRTRPARKQTRGQPVFLIQVCPAHGFDRLPKSAFEQIRLYAKNDVAVNLKLIKAFTDITLTLSSGANRLIMADLGRRLQAGFSTSHEKEVIEEMKRRLMTLEGLAAAQKPMPSNS